MRSGLSGWALSPKTSVLVRKRKTYTRRRKDHEKMEGETGIMQPQDKDYPKPPEDERDKEMFFLKA